MDALVLPLQVECRCRALAQALSIIQQCLILLLQIFVLNLQLVMGFLSLKGFLRRRRRFSELSICPFEFDGRSRFVNEMLRPNPALYTVSCFYQGPGIIAAVLGLSDQAQTCAAGQRRFYNLTVVAHSR